MEGVISGGGREGRGVRSGGGQEGRRVGGSLDQRIMNIYLRRLG